MKVKCWIEAARLRTLPLSVSGIIVGSALAFSQTEFDVLLFSLLMATTVLLQILSNFANDLGDFQHGTDNADRVGPKRTLQSGGLTVSDMKRGISVAVILSLIVGMIMLWVAFGFGTCFWIFLVIGILAIIASIRYTVGRNPFGYRGLGDFMVLVFFGLATVVGSYFIVTQSLSVESWLLGFALGFLSMGVLNINNLRDAESDLKSGKRTIVVKLGVKFGQAYHLTLCVLSVALIAYCLYCQSSALSLLWIALPSVLLLLHGLKVFRADDVKKLDPELKKLSLTTLLMSVLFAVAMVM